VARERALDPQALGQHIDRLYSAALALCDSREDAEDLVQETYAQVLARPRFLRRDDDLVYLVQALRNTFFNQQRARARRPRTAELSEAEVIDVRADTRPHDALDAIAVRAAILALPAPFRDAVIAVDVAGLSYAQAARALRAPVGTITSRLARGRRQLARALEAGPAVEVVPAPRPDAVVSTRPAPAGLRPPDGWGARGGTGRAARAPAHPRRP